MQHTRGENLFLKALDSYKKSLMCVVGVPGNSGDVLLKRGLELYLSSHGYRVVEDDSASVVIVHGGGNIDDVWGVGVELLRRIPTQYPGATIIVAPSTCHFFTTDFASVLNCIQSPVFFFTRERYSYDRLVRMKLNSNIQVELADDTAFLLEGTQYIADLKDRATSEYNLFAFRTDRESTIVPFESHLDRHTLYERMKYWIAMRSIKRFVRDQHMLHPASRSVFDDVSYRDFDTFVERILHASSINTDRLHVGILGALLGKPVRLYKTSYDKIPGVYNMSLCRYPNVTVSW